MKRKTCKAVLVFGFLFLLFLFPGASLSGAKTGLLLWSDTVLPTLLPFLIVSNLILALHVTDCLSAFLYPVLHFLFGVTRNGCYPILIGMLSGYPLGAKACADMVRSGQITPREGQFLLSFCNNASPMFVLSFIAVQCLCLPRFRFLILGVILLSAVTSGFMYRFFTRKQAAEKTGAACAPPQSGNREFSFFTLLDSAILDAFRILVKVGGYIVLFSVLARIVASLPFLPALIRLSVIGLLEITTGAAAIAGSGLKTAQKIVLTLALTAFGGFSSLAQTKSVITGSGLSIRIYLAAKLINALVCVLFSLLLLQIL